MWNTAAAWLLMAASTAPIATPRDVVQSAVLRVIAALDAARSDRLEASHAGPPDFGRARIEIRRVASELFDFDEVARRTLSRHWAARTPAERTEFVRLFTDFLERSYVGKLEAYAGEKIVYVGEIVDGRYATVRSRILTGRRTDTGLDYQLHLAKGRWKVYDLLIDGIGFVSTYRSEFNRVIQSSGYDDLIKRLRKRSSTPLAMGGPEMAPHTPQRSDRPGEAVALLDTAADSLVF